MMHIGYIPVVLMMTVLELPISGQEHDSLRSISLSEVVVNSSYRDIVRKNATLHVNVADKRFLQDHFTGNLMQSLEHIPGVQSMDIGSGFSKPMIRGMGFNRVSVAENNIKQEGQQWGADHGLEIDAFDVERVIIRKGPASLLYGSDAMGGIIEISRIPAPAGNQVYGEAVLLGKSVNGTLGASVMTGIKRNAWHTKIRLSGQYFGDYRVPTDTVIYLTQRLPVSNGKLKNTAGHENDGSLFTEYRKGRYYANYSISNTYQKTGFFPGAHGIPDAGRLLDDGDSRNTELPYSTVNHLKVTGRQQYSWGRIIGSVDLGYQNNHREEWSRFHTHYGTQPVPESDPDKELSFSLNTFSASVKARVIGLSRWEHTAGWDIQYQQNRIGGYSFLLPGYNRITTGLLWLSTFRPAPGISVSGGIRYDYGHMDISAYLDTYLETYLYERGYSGEQVEDLRWRSYPVDRGFGDFSGSLGIAWNPGIYHLLKANIGKSFRLPGANELASNGVHHGTFRHERGDAGLDSEQGWQLDISYTYERNRISLSVSPFGYWFSNYIYLNPTGEWSVLPHAGQIYRYTEAEVLFAGAEIEFGFDILDQLNYSFAGEYVYTRNMDERIPLVFSPPASMRNTLTWKHRLFRVYAGLHSIAAQHRVSRNEDPTSGANLLDVGTSVNIPLGRMTLDLSVSLQNVFNTKYYNHLSFYRKVEIPEPGRNLQILIKIPFKNNLK